MKYIQNSPLDEHRTAHTIGYTYHGLFKEYRTNLNLILISSSNIGDGPTGFLLDALFVVVSKKTKEAWKCLVVNNELKKQ
jgi:hypothetical protein